MFELQAIEGVCIRCDEPFSREIKIEPWTFGPGDMRFHYCDECLAVRLAERDQFYAACQAKARATCELEGKHVSLYQSWLDGAWHRSAEVPTAVGYRHCRRGSCAGVTPVGGGIEHSTSSPEGE